MEGIIETLAGQLAGYGVLGAWALYLIYQNWSKDQIIQSRDERINQLIDRAFANESESTKTLTELTILVRSMKSGA